jgi:acetylglutamate kinase
MKKVLMKKTVIIKYGGHAFENKESVEILVNNIKKFQKKNFGVIIVHGGTPSVNQKLKEKNIVAEMVEGIRVTTKEVVEIVQESLLGKDAVEIVKLLNKNDIVSLGLNGCDCSLLKCEKFVHSNGIDYGMVGKVVSVNKVILRTLIEKNIVPVISPIGVDDYGNCYNLNSDPLAYKVATSIGADLLVMVTNIDGVRKNIDDPTTKIDVLDKDLMEELIDKKIISGPMITKIKACVDYTNETKNNSYIVDSNVLIDNKVFNSNTCGTKIICDKDFEFRLANSDDVPYISEIVSKSFKDYQKNISYPASPLYETTEELFSDILNNYVYVGICDNKIISSIRVREEFPYARIYRVCVDPEYYNKGYGSKMLEYVEHYFKNKGIIYLGLTTIENVESLRKFYEKNGYKTEYISNNRGYPKAIMIKNISDKNNIETNLFL